MTPMKKMVQIWLLMFALAASAQTDRVLYGYHCTSDVTDVTQNPQYWIAMSGATRQLPMPNGATATGPIGLGFDFYYMGETFRTVAITNTGRVYFGNTNAQDEMCILPFGDSLIVGIGGEVNTRVSGAIGQRKFVAWFSQTTQSGNVLLQWQLQLSEADNSVRIVLKEVASNVMMLVGGTINLVGRSHEMVSINLSSRSFDIVPTLGDMALWPRGQTRYMFHLVPESLCGHPTGISVTQVQSTAAQLSWRPVGGASQYEIEYGRPGFSSGTTVNTSQTHVGLTGLTASTKYEVRLRTRCRNGEYSDWVSRSFNTLCGDEREPTFVYWNFYDSTVQCCTGTRTYPSAIVRVVDSGSSSIDSRHTVHSDPTEYDPRTCNGLRTVPEGYCYSVRLGNWQGRREQESIIYKVRVDTGQADLLILRYAIVEENPNHPPEDQPHFIFAIRDQQGNTVDSCLYADFVAGDLSGWNTCYDVVWHDWMAVGVDLSSLHGQEIQIYLDNADCSNGAHYGYAYFVLEYASKNIASSDCGGSVENTFTAPAGFAYRWYNADSPSDTLSTSRQLHVTTSGTYCCRVTYLHTSAECGFTLTTHAGPRYPVARFLRIPQSICGSEILFSNMSVVATDLAHQNLTSEPCESYLWRFDDGTTSTMTSPTHTFRTNGTHRVTLTAMLANGLCRDSVTQTFHLRYPLDTTYVFDTFCMGDTLLVGDVPVMMSGRYNFVFQDDIGCDSVVQVDLTVHPSYTLLVEDTLPAGTFFPVGDTGLYAPGRGEFFFQTLDGCDSILQVSLSCIHETDTTVCIDALPLVWRGIRFTAERSDTLMLRSVDGCDSLEVMTLHVRRQAHPPMTVAQSCGAPKHYAITLSANGYTCRWTSTPAMERTAQETSDSMVRFHFYPKDETRLVLLYDYADGPSCPGKDTVLLTLQDYAFFLDLEVRPEILSANDKQLTAHDKSINTIFRQWVVDSVVQKETGVWLTYDVPPQADSVVVLLIGGDSVCVDTARRVIPVIKEDLFFPNVFTPGRDDNNRFQVLGTEVDDFELWIYDRRGVLVFHTTDRHEGWDGTSGGIPCPQGTYAYVCHYTIPIHQWRSRAGTVTLLR